MSVLFSLEEESEGVIEKISRLCNFNNMRELEVNKTGKSPGHFENETLFRRGEVGDWINHFRPEMVERVNKVPEAKITNQCCSCLNRSDKMKEHRADEEEEVHDSNRVGKPLQNFRDESTQPREGGSAQGLDKFKIEVRRRSARGDGSVIGAKWKCDMVVPESCSIVGKELEVVAGSSAFNASKPADQGHDNLNPMLGGLNEVQSGLNLEVDLGHNHLNHEFGGLNEVRNGPELCDAHGNIGVVDVGLGFRESNVS
ncbi:Cytosolic sulfotransferase 15 [Camellia lanceoleosa]|uniref:Cytosolic sulfotransferase 15 n=1 Tax=Camellia lanceoleosa TaxID=1840588 RepID=A0ACC0IL84_9ERIC|nr:Cytosolic sulfotransferase 15 [Camellia lanceoleosa]